MAKTETEQLQEYADEIYGQGFYKVEYVAFKGFYAVSQDSNTPPHSQFLGIASQHAHAYLDDMAELMRLRREDECRASREMPEREESISALAKMTGVPYNTLAKYAREGRFPARKSGGVWLSTRSAVEAAGIKARS